MSGSIGPLLAADEQFNHQAVETFASVGQSDPAWAEKVCGMAAAKDGSVQIAFGFGKYTNRNVVDAYAGVSRGKEQWVVRASRSLNSDPETVNVGPIEYEIIEPLHSVRISLAANEHQPIAFDIVFNAAVPCVVEDREDRRDMHGYRKATDQIRYHQTGVVTGWLEVEGHRIDISQDSWVATRDKSWGIRPQVGIPIADMEPGYESMIPQALAIWNPMLFTRADGSHYAFHHYFLQFSGPGFMHQQLQGGLETEAGKENLVLGLKPVLEFDPATKRLQRGCFNFHMEDGTERPMTFEKLSETGFYLGAGHYHGGDGAYHGSWRGDLHIDGDYVVDASSPEVLARYKQFRDNMIRIEDPVGGGVGYGNCQTYVHGAWPEFGLTGDEPLF
ncbi:hypothetical protein [Oceanicoccus sp. KOV_DT_Chl]|uniref:hypothetical protein n=1 Tax=Oceanicoccus sp. KOV_DT_Chl TaxID=1904639 RepID=UPI000C7B2476|nr:hypothetical protein [Oceanicoccus sp. KOV_DT_Chl]